MQRATADSLPAVLHAEKPPLSAWLRRCSLSDRAATLSRCSYRRACDPSGIVEWRLRLPVCQGGKQVVALKVDVLYGLPPFLSLSSQTPEDSLFHPSYLEGRETAVSIPNMSLSRLVVKSRRIR